jgi:hypothetical protein
MDFFFTGMDERMHALYENYLALIANSPSFDDAVTTYYANRGNAELKRRETLEALRTGKPSRDYLERLLAEAQSGHDQEHISQCQRRLDSLPNMSPRFGYGGPLMLLAHYQGLPTVLVTRLCAHKNVGKCVRSATEGIIALLPLIDQGPPIGERMITISEAMVDYGRRLLGGHWAGKEKSGPHKWLEALQHITQQEQYTPH